MRLLSLIAIFFLAFSCTSTKKASVNSNILNGTWIPISQELGGKVLPKEAFESQKLIVKDSNYIFTAESVDKGIVKYSDGKMDIYGKDGVNSGKHFSALYKCENDQLTICYNLSGTNYPEAFETKGKPLYFLSVFKRSN